MINLLLINLINNLYLLILLIYNYYVHLMYEDVENHIKIMNLLSDMQILYN
jgi:hypothetical protein